MGIDWQSQKFDFIEFLTKMRIQFYSNNIVIYAQKMHKVESMVHFIFLDVYNFTKSLHKY